MGGSHEPGGGTAEDLARAALELARRYSAGATMWCASPEWPWHAQHVAVEFVHPVIVGKRALPAVALGGAGWPEELLAASRPGDVLLAVGTAGAAGLARTVRRASVWGLSTVWVGGGDRPEAGAADHVLWTGPDPLEAAFGGAVVRAYHLLWELAHVCFEHPGLLSGSTAGPGCEPEGHCVTCSDEGRPAEVLDRGDDGLATVRSSAGVEQIDTTLVADAAPGDVLLVHAGTALAVIERGSAP